MTTARRTTILVCLAVAAFVAVCAWCVYCHSTGLQRVARRIGIETCGDCAGPNLTPAQHTIHVEAYMGDRIQIADGMTQRGPVVAMPDGWSLFDPAPLGGVVIDLEWDTRLVGKVWPGG